MDRTSFPFALVLRRFAVALVLLAVPAAALTAQEPEQWPQDDNYNEPQPDNSQQPGYGQQQYAPPQTDDYAQADPQQGYYNQQSGYPTAQGMDAQQLEQLVAPIALYPDALLAQILAGSTYPAQIAAADQWMRSMGNAPPEQVAAAANGQTGWDPSVKALTAYPQVLAMMNQNLQWTTSLGNAYYNQPQDLLQTVQVLRQRAQSAGNLQSTPQEEVTSNQGYIAVQPANPEVVYVPTYNPWAAYGQPIMAYPGYEPLDAIGAVVGSAVQFGLEFAVGPFLRFPFGFVNWGCDWFGNSILFNHGAWYSRSGSVRDWGFAHGGPRAFRGGEFARYGDRYGRGGYGGAGYGRGGLNAYHNQPGFNRGGSQFPVARAGGGYENRNQGGYDRRSNLPIARPGQGFDGRNQGGSNRGNPGYNGGSGRGFLGSGNPSHPASPQQYAYNHGSLQAPIGRPQPYGGNSQLFSNHGQSYGYGSQQYGRTQQPSNYGNHSFGSDSYPRPTPGYSGGRGYSAPSQSYRAPAPSFGRSYSQPSSHSFGGGSGGSGGGFHLFGGGHSSSPSYGGGHSFGGGGHSNGGGHSGGGGHHH